MPNQETKKKLIILLEGAYRGLKFQLLQMHI